MGVSARLPPEREDTDRSLRAEREKTDGELSTATRHLEQRADDVVQHARQVADETLSSAHAKADAELTRAGASLEVRAIAHDEEAIAEATLSAERRTANRQLAGERGQLRRIQESILGRERGQTDKHLSIERASCDESAELILADLAEAMRLRDEFLTLAGHELRTPLTSLTLNLQAVAKEAATQPESPSTERLTRHVERAHRQVKRLSVLVANLLDASRITSGDLVLNLAAVDLGVVVREVVTWHRPQAEAIGCALEVHAPTVIGCWDELRLGQTVSHLLTNALTFGPGKPVKIHLEADAQKATLTVQDEGIGIAPEAKLHIFERFGRGVSILNYGGLGLGLYVSRTNVAAMGGSLSVHSEPGRGATFTVELPLAGPGR